MASTAQERHHWRSALAEVDTSRETLTLLNLLHAPPGSALRQLATLLSRLEYLSHILVWTRKSDATLADSCDIDLVELPRLRLSFTAESSAAGLRLHCVEHAGLSVSGRDRMDARTRELLKGLPHSLLLENEVGELSVLVSATTLPSRPALAAAVFSTEVVLDRSNKAWLKSVGNAPAYLYSVHVGRLGLAAPTLAAGLYLLLLRFLDRQYASVFRTASCCVSDMPLSAEELQIFEQLGTLSHDVHPDAHACRLKIALVTRGTAHGALCATKLWSLRDEYACYVAKASFVSALCRLSIAEELHYC